MTEFIYVLLFLAFSVHVITSVIIFRNLRSKMELEIARVDAKNRKLEELLEIRRTHQSAIVRRIIDLSKKHNKLATLFEEHGHGLLDEDTMQPMVHSTAPVNLVEIVQNMMNHAGIDPGVSLD
jgi:hypothetical protein